MKQNHYSNDSNSDADIDNDYDLSFNTELNLTQDSYSGKFKILL